MGISRTKKSLLVLGLLGYICGCRATSEVVSEWRSPWRSAAHGTTKGVIQRPSSPSAASAWTYQRKTEQGGVPFDENVADPTPSNVPTIHGNVYAAPQENVLEQVPAQQTIPQDNLLEKRVAPPLPDVY